LGVILSYLQIIIFFISCFFAYVIAMRRGLN
jgi:hypothetical protein